MNNNESEFSSYMNKFVKSILALGVTSALGMSAVNAATYKVVDLGDVPTVKYTYSQKENNSGELAISGTNMYNFPIQFQYLTKDDYDDIVKLAKDNFEQVFELVDIENEAALRAGNPTANDLSWVIRYLTARAGSTLYQKIGNVFAMTNVGGDTTLFNIFDQKFAGTESFTRSTADYISGITNEGWIYGSGSAPSLPTPYVVTNKFGNYDVGDTIHNWRRNFTRRGFFSPDNGATIVEIIPPSETELPVEQRFGGESAVLDMSESRIAIGFASTSIDKSAIDFITDESNGCADAKYLSDRNITREDCISSRISSAYNIEAMKWVVDINGIVSTERLGHLVTPHVDDKREFINFAQAVNSHGVAVGYAHGWRDENETSPSKTERRNFYAVVYKNGTVKDFTDDHSEFYNSRAFDINDAGIAVGHVTTLVNGTDRTKFYHVDTNAENMTMVMPKDFFNGSSSTARAINENGMIVGEGEVETHSTNNGVPRRRNAFLYDIASQKFTNINDFLPCDSAYTIIEARDINDANEISASALFKVPRRDAKGDLVKDDKGEQVLEDVIRAVRVVPTEGEIEDCSIVNPPVKRKGAGFGFASLFLLSLVALRRRFS